MGVLEDPPLICLYTSGLDSGAGLVARMNDNPSRPVIPVTVWHQPRQRHLVHQQYDFLRGHYRKQGFGTQIEPLIVKVAMMWPSAAEEKNQETSQRSRSFLYAALGAITAIMHGQRTIEMFESGVGAINLPLMAGMVGSRALRNLVHPNQQDSVDERVVDSTTREKETSQKKTAYLLKHPEDSPWN